MFDIEWQKKNFINHVATFQDLGNIKILDFQNPGHSEYRIRFLFEEDHYRLHISGDLGDLIAYNFTNMRYETFGDFVNNTGYFEEKICCHERSIYFYDYESAKTELIRNANEYGWVTDEEINQEEHDEEIEQLIYEVLEDFNDRTGISQKGVEALSKYDSDCYEYAYDLGKEPTGILDLYMLAFKLAQEDLETRIGGEG